MSFRNVATFFGVFIVNLVVYLVLRSQSAPTSSSKISCLREVQTVPSQTQQPHRNIFPLLVQDSELRIKFSNGSEYSIAPVDPTRRMLQRLADPQVNISRIIMEIGTNTKPDFMGVLADPTTYFIAFEPLPYIFPIMVANVVPTAAVKENFLPIPAAVSPTPGYLTIHESSIPGCSSLLTLSSKAGESFKAEADSRVQAAKNTKKRPHVSALRMAGVCTKSKKNHTIPVFPLSHFLPFIPKERFIDLIVIDAQGYDYFVVKSLGEERHRVANVVLECQNLEPGHPKLLTVGAKTCGEQYNCVAQTWGWTPRFCWVNSAASVELNCVYSNPQFIENRISVVHESVASTTFPVARVKFESLVLPGTPANCD
eukprot:PhF_6_TR42170/c0_g2_i2/m.63760